MASTSTLKRSLSELNDCNNPIHVLYTPPGQHPKAEVIFVHDIQQSEHEKPHLQTWMSSSTPSVCWPEVWLSAEFPNARISSVHYDAVIWKTNTAGHMGMYQIAENLYQDILSIYDQKAQENCPIFLVGHGLGGLIIKNVILAMNLKLSSILGCVTTGYASWEGTFVQKLSCFLKNVTGVFYYNTPHLGSRLADYTTSFRQGNPLLEIMKTLSTDASQHNMWFSKWRKSNGCRTSTICAAVQTEVALWYGNWSTHVVEEASARHDTDFFYTSRSSDHHHICKPSNNKTDVRFRRLVAFIFGEEMLPREVHPGAQEDRLVASSLSGERLPRIVGPDAQIEDSALTKVLNQVLSHVSKLRQGKGVWLKTDDLEKIRKVPEMRNSLMDCLKKAHLSKTMIGGELELWTPSNDEDLSTLKD